MKISKQARREARELFRATAPNGTMDENRVRAAVSALIEKKPRGFTEILSHFQRLVRLEVARRTAQIQSATALPAPMQAQVQAELTRRYGPGLNFVFTQNPALLGGVRVQVGGDVFDGSVENRLRALQESF